MCGRYYIPEPDDDSGFQAIWAQIKNTYQNSPVLSNMKHGEIFPSDIVPVLTEKAPVLMKWGFLRFDGKGLVINARLESANERPIFKKAYDARRCLIPASNYFEWEKGGARNRKCALGTGAPIFMAGLFRFEDTPQLPRFVILTRPAVPDIAFIHERMPVIVPEHLRRRWLTTCIEAQEMLANAEKNIKYAMLDKTYGQR